MPLVHVPRAGELDIEVPAAVVGYLYILIYRQFFVELVGRSQVDILYKIHIFITQ